MSSLVLLNKYISENRSISNLKWKYYKYPLNWVHQKEPTNLNHVGPVLNLWIVLCVIQKGTNNISFSHNEPSKKTMAYFKHLFCVHLMTCKQMHIPGICSLLTAFQNKKKVKHWLIKPCTNPLFWLQTFPITS